VHELLDRLARGEDLSAAEMSGVFGQMVEGSLEPAVVAAFLMGLRCKGETPTEIAGAAAALRAHALAFPSPPGPLIDVCGTGGDGSGTINVSTLSAIVLAEMGLAVAKHGNRSVSSRCGSADLLEAFGVRLDPSPQVAAACLSEVGICFLFAPQYHGGLRHAMPVRRALRIRTVFNLLGPLVNPARPALQLMGVYDPSLLETVARTLGALGVERALVVHGGGLDELTIAGSSAAVLWEDGAVRHLEICPEDAGLGRHPLAALAGGDPAENLRLARGLLAGEGSAAQTEAVALNAGAAAWLAGVVPDLRAGAQQALATLRGGRCLERVQRWAERSHGA